MKHPAPPRRRADRRRFLKTAATLSAGAAAGFPAIVRAQSPVIRLGYVSPQTGPLSLFAEADDFILGNLAESFKRGAEINGRRVPVEVLVKDSQSNPNRAAEVAAELILSEEVDMMLVASTPETTNPVSDQCEVYEKPCISTVAPWQPWFFTRGGDPAKGFNFTHHFFWGLEDVIAVFTNMWDSSGAEKRVGGLFPNDGDGNAWGDPKLGFPPVLAEKGYELTDPGRYQNLSDDFSAQIAAFKKARAEIVTGVVLPPDWTTFWKQSLRQGFKPKVASVGKAILFPVAVEALGREGDNLSSEVWWSPSHPFSSSLTGQSAGALAADYENETGRQWTQPIGFVHALFEAAFQALAGAGERSSEAISAAVGKMKADTIVGPLDWTAGPVPNVAKTPLVGGQWRLGGKFNYELAVVDNRAAPNIPTTGEFRLIT